MTDKFLADRNILDGQLRAARNRLADAEKELAEAQRENDRILFEKTNKENEVDRWKQRYEDLEKASQNRLEDLAKRLEKQKKSDIDAEINNVKRDFEREKEKIEFEMRDLKHQLEEANRKAEILANEIDRLSQISVEKANEAENWKNKCIGQERNAQARLEELRVELEMEQRNALVCSNTSIIIF